MAGTLVIDTLKASSGVLATQNGMTGIAKAWVYFAGASGSVNGSFNVSSVTRTNTGRYTVNFSTSMPNANYATVSTTINGNIAFMVSQATGSTSIASYNQPSAAYNDADMCCAVLGS